MKINKNCIKSYLKIDKEKGTMTNKYKNFWNDLRHFLTNEEIISFNEITSEVADSFFNHELKVAEILFGAFMNIVENTSGKKSTSVLYHQNKVCRVMQIISQCWKK